MNLADAVHARRQIPLLWANQIDANLSEIREIVEGVLTAGGMSMVFGDSNAGKTTLVLDLAFGMPEGLPWLGRRVEVGAVVYIACEGSASIKRRLEAYRRHHGRTVGAFGLIPCTLNLMDPSSDVDALIELVKDTIAELGQLVQLVVVDTVARAMAGANENAGEDMARLVSAGDRIRQETGAHVMFVHHSGKDSAKGARGHSSLRAAIDTELEVTAEAPIHTVTVTKQRDLDTKGQRLSGRFVAVELGHNQWGSPVTACVVEPVVEESEHLKAVVDAEARQRAEAVVRSGFSRLLEMGVQPTDGHTSPDYLPKQLAEKGLAQGFDRKEMAAAMHRLMTAGVFARGVVGRYGSNRTPRQGLVLGDAA